MEGISEKIANKIAIWSIGGDSEDAKEQIEILTYGYTLVIENLYKTIILLLVALATGTLMKTLIIIGSFVLLRIFAGGIHCRSGLGCTACMLGVWIVGLLVSKIRIILPILVLMLGCIIVIVMKYAPQATRNNPILSEKIRQQKRIGSIVTMSILLITGCVCGVCFGRIDIMNMVVTSLYIEALSILLLYEKEGKSNEELERIGC